MRPEPLIIPISLLGHYLATITNWWSIRYGMSPESESDTDWVNFVKIELETQADPADLPFLFLLCLALPDLPELDLTIYNQSDVHWTNGEMYLVARTLAGLIDFRDIEHVNRVELSNEPLDIWRLNIRPTLEIPRNLNTIDPNQKGN